jgi:hypothetical protein
MPASEYSSAACPYTWTSVSLQSRYIVSSVGMHPDAIHISVADHIRATSPTVVGFAYLTLVLR